jgi:Na+/H+-translocating membrane pyrophosphatase
VSWSQSPRVVHGHPVVRFDPRMLLAIDVGNTNIVYGLFDGATLVHSFASRACAVAPPTSTPSRFARFSR